MGLGKERVKIIQISSFPCPACSTRFCGTQNVTYLYFFAVIMVAFIDIIIAEKVKRKTQQLENTENPSTAGHLLRENHALKPHDSSIITMNLN